MTVLDMEIGSARLEVEIQSQQAGLTSIPPEISDQDVNRELEHAATAGIAATG
jgi:hypothetical protein